MYGKRLALGALVVALVVGVSGALSNSAGQSQQPVLGVAYGGTKSVDAVWLRLDSSRLSIAAAEIPFEIAQGRCKNDPNGYFGVAYVGYHFQEPARVSPEGTFRTTVNNRYRNAGIVYEEHATVTGTVTAERASGTIRAQTIATRPNGRVARCSSLAKLWSAIN